MTEAATTETNNRDDLIPEGGPHIPSIGDNTGSAIPAAELERLTHDIIAALKTVYDPEIPVNIVDLGLIYSVGQEEGNVKVEMTLTSPSCPAGPQIVQQSKMALERLEDVEQADITITLSPPWTPERMTDDAKDQLGIF